MFAGIHERITPISNLHWYPSFTHKDFIHHLYANSLNTHSETFDKFAFAASQSQMVLLGTILYKLLHDDAINDSYNRLNCRFLAFLLLDQSSHFTRNSKLHYYWFSLLFSRIYTKNGQLLFWRRCKRG